MRTFFALTLLLAFSSGAQAASVPFSELSAARHAPAKVGERVVLYFWASWCPDCREKLGGPLQAFRDSLKGVQVLTVNADRNADKGLAYADEIKLALPVYRDEEKAVTKSLKLFGVPAWAVLERKADGWEKLGASTGSDFTQIRALLGGKQ